MNSEYSARSIAKLTGMTVANVYRRAHSLGFHANRGFSEHEAYLICTYKRKNHKSTQGLESEVDRLRLAMERMGVNLTQIAKEDDAMVAAI